MADTLESWLEKHKNEFTLTDNGKVHCALTGHDIPKRLADLQQHLEGRVYRRAEKAAQLAAKKRGVDFEKLAPHIVPHKRDPTKCFCKLTQLVLNNDEQEVEAHMKGRKFQFVLSLLKPKKETKEAEEDELWSRAPPELSDGDEGEEEEEEEEGESNELGFPYVARGKRPARGNDGEEGDEGEEDDGEEEEEEEEEEPAQPAKKTKSAQSKPTKSTTTTQAPAMKQQNQQKQAKPTQQPKQAKPQAKKQGKQQVKPQGQPQKASSRKKDVKRKKHGNAT